MGILTRHDPVFYRTTCRFSNGIVRMSWALRPEFTAPGPYTFTLQRSYSGAPGADEWEDCSESAVDVVALSSLPDRGLNRTGFQPWNYRIRLELPRDGGPFFSNPAHGSGGPSDRLTREARAVAYEWRVRGKRGVADFWHGWILKRKRRGVRPPDRPGLASRHPISGAPMGPEVRSTAGAEFEGGYYAPEPVLVERLSMLGTKGRRSPAGPDDQRKRFFRARTLDFPPIQEDDVFIGADVDRRFSYSDVEERAVAGHVPLVVHFTARIAPADDPIYRIAIPDGTPIAK